MRNGIFLAGKFTKYLQVLIFQNYKKSENENPSDGKDYANQVKPIHYVSCEEVRKSSFPVIHKVDNVGIFIKEI